MCRSPGCFNGFGSCGWPSPLTFDWQLHAMGCGINKFVSAVCGLSSPWSLTDHPVCFRSYCMPVRTCDPVVIWLRHRVALLRRSGDICLVRVNLLAASAELSLLSVFRRYPGSSLTILYTSALTRYSLRTYLAFRLRVNLELVYKMSRHFVLIKARMTAIGPYVVVFWTLSRLVLVRKGCDAAFLLYSQSNMVEEAVTSRPDREIA